jgi:hypothetical protein
MEMNKTLLQASAVVGVILFATVVALAMRVQGLDNRIIQLQQALDERPAEERVVEVQKSDSDTVIIQDSELVDTVERLMDEIDLLRAELDSVRRDIDAGLAGLPSPPGRRPVDVEEPMNVVRPIRNNDTHPQIVELTELLEKGEVQIVGAAFDGLTKEQAEALKREMKKIRERKAELERQKAYQDSLSEPGRKYGNGRE